MVINNGKLFNKNFEILYISQRKSIQQGWDVGESQGWAAREPGVWSCPSPPPPHDANDTTTGFHQWPKFCFPCRSFLYQL